MIGKPPPPVGPQLPPPQRGLATWKKVLRVIVVVYGVMFVGLIFMVLAYAIVHESSPDGGPNQDDRCGELPPAGGQPEIVAFQRCIRDVAGVAPRQEVCDEQGNEWIELEDGFVMCLSPGTWTADGPATQAACENSGIGIWDGDSCLNPAPPPVEPDGGIGDGAEPRPEDLESGSHNGQEGD